MRRLLYVLSVGLVVITTLSVAFHCRAEEVAVSQQYASLTPVDREPSKTDEQAIRELIERYRLGYQQENMQILASVFIDFTPALRNALCNYRNNAKDLTVQIEGIRVSPVNDHEATATFIRHDRFIDAQTGKSIRVQAQLIKQFIRQNGQWKMLATADVR